MTANLIVNLRHLEGKLRTEKFTSSIWPVGESVELVLITNCCGRAQPTAGGATLGQQAGLYNRTSE